MRIIAKTGVQLGVHVYHKGDVADYDGAITQRIVDNFSAADGSALTLSGVAESAKDARAEAGRAESDEGKIMRCCEVMKREGIMQALDGMNITYSPKSRTEYLAKLLLQNRGELAE